MKKLLFLFCGLLLFGCHSKPKVTHVHGITPTTPSYMQTKMKLIDGKAIAKEIRLAIKEEVSQIRGRKPGLAFILIGDDPASQTYVRMKNQGCAEVDFYSETVSLPADISQENLLKEIKRLNNDERIDGILVQQPFF